MGGPLPLPLPLPSIPPFYGRAFTFTFTFAFAFAFAFSFSFALFVYLRNLVIFSLFSSAIKYIPPICVFTYSSQYFFVFSFSSFISSSLLQFLLFHQVSYPFSFLNMDKVNHLNKLFFRPIENEIFDSHCVLFPPLVNVLLYF